MNTPVYFISDVHLRLTLNNDEKKRREKFYALLDKISETGGSCFFVGDLFDFYFEYNDLIPKAYSDFYNKAIDMKKKNVKLYFLTGNHDYWYQDFLENNITPVLIGTRSEEDIIKSILQSCPQAINLAEQTSLADLANLARKAKFAIGNDTGPLHVIAPTGCPSLVIFSKYSNPKKHAPKGKNVITIQRDILETLTPEEIADEVKKLRSF